MNVGHLEAKEASNWDCYVFHDVDLLPEDDRNLYACAPEGPRHLSVAVNTFKYRLPYQMIFGGVTAFTEDQFERINGFSNMYWGWGRSIMTDEGHVKVLHKETLLRVDFMFINRQNESHDRWRGR